MSAAWKIIKTQKQRETSMEVLVATTIYTETTTGSFNLDLNILRELGRPGVIQVPHHHIIRKSSAV
jgi:hypothetical protein